MPLNGQRIVERLVVTAAELVGRELGPCCICECVEGVHHLVNLDGLSPIPGRGWGCMTCGRSPHGAVAVLCRACLDAYQSGRAVLRYICNGVPWLDGRSPFIALKGTWRHDLAMHAGQDGGF